MPRHKPSSSQDQLDSQNIECCGSSKLQPLLATKFEWTPSVIGLNLTIFGLGPTIFGLSLTIFGLGLLIFGLSPTTFGLVPTTFGKNFRLRPLQI